MKNRYLFFAFIIATLLIFSSCASTTPLINASAHSDSLAVQKLLKEGANINEPDSNGSTPLIHATRAGNADVVKQLIKSGADIKAKDKKGYDALLYAIDYGYYEISKLLLDKGADINSKDSGGATALMHAVWNSKSDVAKLLLKKGADINAKDKQKGDALIYAVDNGDYELTELLLNKGANVNSKDYTNTTPIMHAVLRTTNEKLVSLLIKKGANLNEKDDEGYTPLGYALFVRKMALADEIKKGMAGVRKDMPSAKIVFIRESELSFGEQDIFVYIDEKIVANLREKNSSDYIYINPGKCTMVIKGGKLEGNYVKSFDAVVGQTYYFEVTRRIGKLIGGLIGGVIESQIKGEESVSGGTYKITQLEESVAKEKINALNKKRNKLSK